jgi:peptidoglycan/xylan/chitin deacetylase (PgdA/CDA1 family)
MTASRYLLRFDDICPTMNWRTWDTIEKHLVHHDIRPILAVVPDNQDPKLMVDPPAPDFWDRVRRWQGMGYTIGLHGYQHVYVNRNKGMMKLTPNSEFTGLPHAEQAEKIRKGLAIFKEQGVHPDLFVAPSHSFDRTTLDVLLEHGVNVISDGPWPWPHLEDGKLFWIPQQLWRLTPRSQGLWTACFHPMEWNPADLDNFLRQVTRFADQITDLAEVQRIYGERRLTLGDRLRAQSSFFWYHQMRPFLKRCVMRVVGQRAPAR